MLPTGVYVGGPRDKPQTNHTPFEIGCLAAAGGPKAKASYMSLAWTKTNTPM